MDKSDKLFDLDETTIKKLKPILESQSIDINTFINDLLDKCTTQEKDLALSKARRLDIDALSDAIGNGIYVLDRDGKIIHANDYYCTLTGLWQNEYLNLPAKMVLDKYFFNTRAVSLEALKTHKKATGIGRSKRTNKDLLVTAIPVVNKKRDEVTEVITVLRDITELVQLEKQLKSNLEKTELYKEELNYYRSLEQEEHTIIGRSDGMEKLKNLIPQVAPVDSTLLLFGETGVGKEVIAKEIHRRSNRRNKPYIKVNCAAIPASLLESELFGYEKGAFTGAQNKRKLGMFEMANHGTILLDEIGELSLDLQPKLLRVLQDRELYRVGGNDPVKLDIRVIASTNRDLKEEVDEGNFRTDLYYRLCVIPLHVPPLRERKDDIPLLAQHFLSKLNRVYRMGKSFSTGAMDIFKQYEWPGNVRELENLVERLMVISKENIIDEGEVSSIIGGSFMGSIIVNSSDGILKTSIDKFEKNLIEKTLKETGSSYKAAKVLGITQSTVIRKAQRLGISNWK